MTRTDSHSILLIVTRATAICVVVLQLSGAIWAAWAGLADWGFVALLAPVSIIVMATLLWRYADVLLRAAESGGETANLESDIAPREWQYIVFSAIGPWLALSGAISLVWWITAVPRMNAIGVMTTYGTYLDDPDNLAMLLATVFRFAAGVALLLGSRGLIGLLWRIRKY